METTTDIISFIDDYFYAIIGVLALLLVVLIAYLGTRKPAVTKPFYKNKGFIAAVSIAVILLASLLIWYFFIKIKEPVTNL